MSKPWFHINSVTYSSPILTVNLNFARLRGNVLGNNTISIDGFSGSLSYTEDKRFATNEIATFSVGALGTNSTATYVDPVGITWSFSGAPNTNTNAKLTIGSTQLSSFTSSGTTLSSFISGIATSIVGNSMGVSAATTSTTLFVTVPNTGNLYNNTAVTLNLTSGGSTIVATSSQGLSNSGTYSLGTTRYNLRMTTPVGGYVEEFTTNASLTASIIL